MLGVFRVHQRGADQAFVAYVAGALADFTAVFVHKLQDDGLHGGLGFEGGFEQVTALSTISSRTRLPSTARMRMFASKTMALPLMRLWLSAFS